MARLRNSRSTNRAYSMTHTNIKRFTLITFDVPELLYFVKVAIDEYINVTFVYNLYIISKEMRFFNIKSELLIQYLFVYKISVY